MKYFKKSILVTFAVVLTTIALTSVPIVDKIQLENSWQYPFFYASTLPLIYYVATGYLVLLAILNRDRYVKLLSVILIAVLVEFTPAIMLANPWLPDQYPYLAEAATLVKNAHVTQFHHLDQTPGLALMFSQFMLITGLGPFEVSKFYPLLMVLVTPLVFLTGEKVCGDGALPSLLFFGFIFHQPNAYHRNTFFPILFIVLLFLMIKSFVERKFEYPIAYVLVASVLVISYPGVVVPIISLILVAILFVLLYKGEQRIVRFNTPILLAIIFLGWYMFAAEWQFGRMVGDIFSGLQEFIFPTTERLVEITAYGGGGLTNVFRWLTDVRLILTILLVSLAAIPSIYIMLKRRKFDFNSVFTSFLFLATGAQFLLLVSFIYYGLPTAFKLHTFFVYLPALCIPLLLKISVKHSNKIKAVLGISALVLLLLVPLLSYSTIPFLHSPSSELRAKVFIDAYYSGSEPVLATELNLPYSLFGVLMNKTVVEPKAILRPENPIDQNSSYLILQRFMTRDGYLVYSPGYKEYLDILVNSLPPTHNLVYESGPYTKLFLVR